MQNERIETLMKPEKKAPKKREPIFHPNNPISPRNWGVAGWVIAIVVFSVVARTLVKADCQTNGQICKFVGQLLND